MGVDAAAAAAAPDRPCLGPPQDASVQKALRHYGKLPFVGYSVVKYRVTAPPGGPRRRRKLVENTGLEPVTSWLQTRRSPS